jgi:hypothetical protein
MAGDSIANRLIAKKQERYQTWNRESNQPEYHSCVAEWGFAKDAKGKQFFGSRLLKKHADPSCPELCSGTPSVYLATGKKKTEFLCRRPHRVLAALNNPYHLDGHLVSTKITGDGHAADPRLCIETPCAHHNTMEGLPQPEDAPHQFILGQTATGIDCCIRIYTPEELKAMCDVVIRSE